MFYTMPYFMRLRISHVCWIFFTSLGYTSSVLIPCNTTYFANLLMLYHAHLVRLRIKLYSVPISPFDHDKFSLDTTVIHVFTIRTKFYTMPHLIRLRRGQKYRKQHNRYCTPHNTPRYPPLSKARTVNHQPRSCPIRSRHRRSETKCDLRVRCKEEDAAHDDGVNDMWCYRSVEEY